MLFDHVTTAFSIGNKTVRLVTDNASNNIAAFSTLLLLGSEAYFMTENEEESDDNSYEIILNTAEKHYPNDEDVQNDLDKLELLILSCFIHTLQLVVKNGFNESACIRFTMV